MKELGSRNSVLSSRRQTAEAMVYLLLAVAAIRLLPFHRIATWMGSASNPDASVPSLLDDAQQIIAHRVGRSVRRAAYRLPVATLCLPQAMAAKAMLDRRGVPSVVHFGVAAETEPGPLQAHAWLTAGTVSVVGTETAAGFQPIADFSRSASPAVARR